MAQLNQVCMRLLVFQLIHTSLFHLNMSQPLLYTLVAYKTIILADYSTKKGNFQQVAKSVLGNISSKRDSKTSYLYDDFVIHILVENEYTFFVIADKDFGNSVPFQYLTDIKDRFIAQYGESAKDKPTFMGLSRDLKGTLSSQMDYYSRPEAHKTKKVKAQLDGLKELMVDNIDKVLDRGNRIDILMEATDGLQDSAQSYRVKSKKLKNKLWWRNIQLILVIVAIIVIVLFVIIWIACGIPAFHNCRELFEKLKKKPDPGSGSGSGSE